LKPEPGTYALVMHCRQNISIRIGRWGLLAVQPGYYIYVGSAFGPGGVQARVARHCRTDKTLHWHIDYLRKVVTPLAVWCSYEPAPLEHAWARALSKMESVSPIVNFGCSDCSCETHLFRTAKKPRLADFSSLLDGDIGSHLFTSSQ
jgi:Uri superfamily endonuclease